VRLDRLRFFNKTLHYQWNNKLKLEQVSAGFGVGFSGFKAGLPKNSVFFWYLAGCHNPDCVRVPGRVNSDTYNRQFAS